MPPFLEQHPYQSLLKTQTPLFYKVGGSNYGTQCLVLNAFVTSLRTLHIVDLWHRLTVPWVRFHSWSRLWLLSIKATSHFSKVALATMWLSRNRIPKSQLEKSSFQNFAQLAMQN